MTHTPESSSKRRAPGWLATPLLLLVAAACCAGPSAQADTTKGKTTTCTLAVENMTCATCPIQVRTAISRVDGVAKADATLEPPQATVTFDPGKTSTQAITAATANIGYPAKVLSCAETKS